MGIGAAFMTQTIPVTQKQAIVKFEIWDTAGQERYKSLAPMYYRGAAVAVVVYDVTNATSYDGAKAWVSELQRSAPKEKTLVVLLGNKRDIVDADPQQRVVDTKDAEAFATEKGLLFAETSVKTGHNVTEIFTQMAEGLELQKKDAHDGSVSITQNRAAGGGCCGS